MTVAYYKVNNGETRRVMLTHIEKSSITGWDVYVGKSPYGHAVRLFLHEFMNKDDVLKWKNRNKNTSYNEGQIL